MKQMASKLLILLMLWGAIAGVGAPSPVSATTGTDPYIGQISLFPYGFAPIGWLPCDGRALLIARNPALFALVGPAFNEKNDTSTTFCLPSLTPPLDNTAYYIATQGLMPYESVETETMQVGEILLFPHNRIPSGFLPCEGATYSISNYEELYGVIGNMFGGDGSASFGVPDLKSLVPDQKSIDVQNPRLRYYIVAKGVAPSADRMGLDGFLGEIILTTYRVVPGGYVRCAGQQDFPINQNGPLNTLLGVRFGGNGTTTFGIPDLRGASPMMDINYYLSITGINPPKPE